MEKFIRIGRVSAVDYTSGMLSVTYPDLDDCVTDKLPVFAFTDEYKMPAVGTEVLVLHLSNGCTAGIVMGRYWNAANPPAVSGEGVFRKELGSSPGEAYIQYTGGSIRIHDPSADSTWASVLSRISTLENRASSLETQVTSLESQLNDLRSRVSALGG